MDRRIRYIDRYDPDFCVSQGEVQRGEHARVGDVRLVVGSSIKKTRAEYGELATNKNMIPRVDGDCWDDQESDTFTETRRWVASRTIFEHSAEVVK